MNNNKEQHRRIDFLLHCLLLLLFFAHFQLTSATVLAGVTIKVGAFLRYFNAF